MIQTRHLASSDEHTPGMEFQTLKSAAQPVNLRSKNLPRITQNLVHLRSLIIAPVMLNQFFSYPWRLGMSPGSSLSDSWTASSIQFFHFCLHFSSVNQLVKIPLCYGPLENEKIDYAFGDLITDELFARS